MAAFRTKGVYTVVALAMAAAFALPIGSASASVPSGTPGPIAVSTGTAAAVRTGLAAIDPATALKTALIGTVATDISPSVNGLGKVAFNGAGNILQADFPSGNNRSQVTTGVAISGGPKWNPAGNAVTFAIGTPATTGIGIVPTNAGIGSVTTLTQSAAGDSGPDYSPDGTYIVTTNGPNVLRINANGSGGRTTLYTGALAVSGVVINPSGTRAYFSETGIGIRYIPFPSGGAVTTVTGSVAGDSQPTFSNDGAKILFSVAGSATGIGQLNADDTGGRVTTIAGSSAFDTDSSEGLKTGTTPPPPGGTPNAVSCGTAAVNAPLGTPASATVTNAPAGTTVVSQAAADQANSPVVATPTAAATTVTVTRTTTAPDLFAHFNIAGLFTGGGLFTNIPVTVTSTWTSGTPASATCTINFKPLLGFFGF